MIDAAEITKLLQLTLLPEEGGHYRETVDDDHPSAIDYLVDRDGFSGLHRLTVAETFHHYAGAPARMLLLHPDGSQSEPLLGTDLAAGERPQVHGPVGTWQGTRTLGDSTLLGATVAPRWDPAMFELGVADALVPN